MPEECNLSKLKERGTLRGYRYDPWPSYSNRFFNTVDGALLCIQFMARRLDAGGSLWCTVKQAARWIGLPNDLIFRRVRAGYYKDVELWPWTKIALGGEQVGFVLFSPQLIRHILWVTRRDAAAYLGMTVHGFFVSFPRKLIREECRAFRGTGKMGFSLWLPDVLRVGGLKKLRAVFGQRQSLSEYEPMLALDPKRVAFLRTSPFTATRLKDAGVGQ